MKRLVFLVEGDTEVIFINQHVIPYLYGKGYRNAMQAQKIVTNRKLNIKGGNINYEYLKNDINRVLAQGNVLITTFLDFFRLPNSFPGYTTDAIKIESVENGVYEDLGKNECIIPYIQKYEIEALMYCCIDGFEIVVDDNKVLEKIQEIISKYENPEDINSGAETAASKRLEALYNYDKVVDGELILEAIGIEKMLEKCPRFSAWIDILESKLDK